MDTPTVEMLDLQAASDEIGVHYQTAYRWVRSGRLRADVVDGKYRISRADIEALNQARQQPRRPRVPSVRRLETAADKMHTALVNGDEPAARRLALDVVSERTPMAELIQRVLVPPLLRIGQEWHAGTISVWVEHRASAIVERILGEVAPNPRGRRRGTAMVASAAGDRHALATTMAAVTLRDNNWHVHHLGADVPAADLVQFCRGHAIDVAVITVTNTDGRETAESTARLIEATGTPVLVGGPGRTLYELVEQVQLAARTPAAHGA